MEEREINEIVLATFYAASLHHGTAGHNRLMLIAKLAKSSEDPDVQTAVRLSEKVANVYAMSLLSVMAAEDQGK